MPAIAPAARCPCHSTRASTSGTAIAMPAPNSSSCHSGRSPIHGRASRQSNRSIVARPPSATMITAVTAITNRHHHLRTNDGCDHAVAMATAVQITQRRMRLVSRSRMPSRKMRSAVTRSTSGPMYVRSLSLSSTRPSCTSAAGRCRPVCGTSHVKNPGTEVRSVRNVAGSAGAMTPPTSRSQYPIRPWRRNVSSPSSSCRSNRIGGGRVASVGSKNGSMTSSGRSIRPSTTASTGGGRWSTAAMTRRAWTNVTTRWRRRSPIGAPSASSESSSASVIGVSAATAWSQDTRRSRPAQ